MPAPLKGLTVRWSLVGAAAETEQALRDYVREESLARFSGMEGLHQKTWQLAPGAFFAGIYLWASAEAREAFLERFRSAPSKVSQLVGSDPERIEEWDVVAVAVGAEGQPSGA